MTAQTLSEWLAERQAASSMTTDTLPLGELVQWETTSDMVRRRAGGFYQVIGVDVKVPREGQREVMGWDQPMIQDLSGPGVIILVVDTDDRVLVHAKAEPGNASSGCVLLAAAIQTSLANLNQAHGGRKPPFSELLGGNLCLTRQTEDGGRFYKKVNHYGWVEVNASQVTLTEDHRWVSLNELKQAVRDGHANCHLRTALLGYLLR